MDHSRAQKTYSIESENICPVFSEVNVDDLNVTSILSNQNAVIRTDHDLDSDEMIIMALGYKQEFKREFSFWSLFSVSFSVLGLLPSIASTFSYSILVIGPTSIPWIISIIFVWCVAASMAEIASAFPTSGGLYSIFIFYSNYRFGIAHTKGSEFFKPLARMLLYQI